MRLLDAALAGTAGALAVVIYELYFAIRRVKEFPWRSPGEARLPVYLVSVVLRLGLGAGAALFCAATGAVDPAAAVSAGVAAPAILEQLGRFRDDDPARLQLPSQPAPGPEERRSASAPQ